MSASLRKYATATASGTHVGIPMIKAGSQDFATGSDWTPATGDVKVSIDGGAQANISTLPAYTNGQWVFQFTSGETTGKSIRVVVVDSATKAVEDQFFVIETFGHASAMFTFDFTATGGKVPATVASGDLTLATDQITSASVSSAAVTKIQTGLATPTNITAGTITTVTTLTNLPTIPSNWLTAAGIAASALNAKGDWNTTTPPTAAANAAATWDLTTSGHTTSGTFGDAMNAAGSAGDPWSTSLPGSYGSGTAGKIVGDNLNATITSRMGTFSLPTNFASMVITNGGLTSINLGQIGLSPRALDAIADAALTVGDCLVAAISGAVGKETVSGTSYTVKTPSTGTTIRTFTLDSSSAPTSRT